MATAHARRVLVWILGLAFAAVVASALEPAQPGFEAARPDGFHVVLLLARNTPGAIPTDLPTGVAKALKDASEVLPFKSYQVQDQAVLRSDGGSSFQMLHLRGPLSRDYELALDTKYRDPAKVSVSVDLSYTSVGTSGATRVLSTEFSARLGETVVVGTSSVKSDQSLVLLITPLAPKGNVPAGPTKAIEVFRATRVVSADPRYGLALLTGTVRIAIHRWSTDAERQALVTAATTGRPRALPAALSALKAPVGYLSPSLRSDGDDGFTRDSLAYAAERREANGVRRITVVWDDPSICWMELVIQADGSGEGFMDRHGRVGVNKAGNDIELKVPGVRSVLLRVRKE